MHLAPELEIIFGDLFTSRYRTCLKGGAEEPLYLPAGNEKSGVHSVIYTRDYFASALHEVAHWCLAGADRRWQTDYGYWYIKGPRTASQQIRFQQVEQVPQALEWIFSSACRFPFRVSLDDPGLIPGLNSGVVQGVVPGAVSGVVPACKNFNRLVQERAIFFTKKGLPLRAAAFAKQLARRFGGNAYLDPQTYMEPPGY